MSDEHLNTATHTFGFALSGLAVGLLGAASIGCTVYLATLLVVYLFSSLSHGLNQPYKELFERLDKGSIFFLIAGTYTPLILASPVCDPVLIGVLWLAAATGFIAKVFYRVEDIAPYVVMGWLPVVAYPGLLMTAQTETLWLVIAGGLCYTFGLAFFMLDRIRGFHPLWHLCVVAGSTFHFIAIYGVR